MQEQLNFLQASFSPPDFLFQIFEQVAPKVLPGHFFAAPPPKKINNYIN